eukprot:CAMPEP_0198231564 /NCGR_PEP_ID=MMETSP1445-20131203/115270_1 /TAXON_ID=36898 /ORGANISM="Pyramimonas sp., Strain CCMP2087" /LENGTH=140 /DNA_ID=CAMNT_0043912187 /DNA_START=117 /DNA_END=536 /DNA_ORIENTATION=+
MLPYDTPLPVLEFEHSRIAHEVAHLRRSNEELAEALKVDGPEREYEIAIDENVAVIAKKGRELEELQIQIDDAKSRGHYGNVPESQAASTGEASGAMDDLHMQVGVQLSAIMGRTADPSTTQTATLEVPSSATAPSDGEW